MLNQLRASTVAGIGLAVFEGNTGHVGNALPNKLPLLHHFVFIREQLGAILPAHQEEQMTLITPIVYLALVTWAIVESSRRWMTLLWTVASLAATLGLFAGAAEIWPDLTEVLGHMALIPTLLVSVLVGANHMQSHPRPSDGKGAF